MKTQLCLVSSQPTPNLTPVLDQTMSPRRVILLVSDNMTEQAERLRSVIEKRRIKVVISSIGDAWDFQLLQQHILDLLTQYPTEVAQQNIVLNATGGTKPMSIAAYEVFRAADLPIFYVHPEHDRVIWLQPNDRENRDLEDRLKLEDFLAAHGVETIATPTRNAPHPGWLEVGREITKRINYYQKALSRLNWLAVKAKHTGLASEKVGKADRAFDDLISLFAQQDLLQREHGRLVFPDESARFFVNGGWLEYLVFDVVRRLRQTDPVIHDIARGLEVARRVQKKPVKNELDVAFLRNNRLHIIECKTAKLSKAGEDAPAAEALYKLDTLGDLLGGLQARAMLVSFKPFKDTHRRRAKAIDIHVCAGEELKTLENRIRQWIA